MSSRCHADAKMCAAVKVLARRQRRAREKAALRRSDDPAPVRISWWVEDAKFMSFKIAGGR